MNACRLEHVSRSYRMGEDLVHALDDVCAEFKQGSFWAIMGSSGAGKSSLLNILGCLDRPSSGRYFVGSQDITALSDDELSQLRLSRLGFIFQSFHLIPGLNVQENIALPMFYKNIGDDLSQERAEELADLVGLSDRLNHRPNELSGGQQQRVAVARALANDPDILLADEPTGNLDSNTSRQVMELLARLNGQGKTILMVTHELEIAAYAHRRLIMADGRIERVE